MDAIESERHQMVIEQIRRRGLDDPRVLEAMEKVPRHLFVPESARSSAYDDWPLPIGLGQTISQPYVVALMTSMLQLKAKDRVLEIGTGSGYQAAVLACVAWEVHTVELIPQLAAQAEMLLRRLEYCNVRVHCGDGSLGWPDAAPYDCIIVTAASPGVPPPLLEQLEVGGRLVIPVESAHDYQLLKLLTRAEGKINETVISSVCFVPLRGVYGRHPKERD